MAVVANVAINVDSRGAPAKLKQVADRSKQVEKAVERMNGDLGRSKREFKSVNNAASQAAGGFSKIGKAIAGVATVAAAFQALKFTIVKTAELETQTRSLKVLTGSLESAQQIIKELQEIGAVTPFTSTELIDTAKRLKAFGVETNKLVDTTKRLGDLAGATGAELNGIATAYGQIQAKGKLQTEELLQLQERGIDIASTLKEQYKLTGAEFSSALQKGQISAQAVEFALQKLTNAGGKYADGAIAQSDTLAGKFSTLQDNVQRFAQSIGQVLTPVLNGILDDINTLISGFNQLFEIGGVERGLRQAGALDNRSRQQLFDDATKEAERLLGIGKITKDTFGQTRLNIFQESLKGLAFNEGLIKPTLATPQAVELPELLQGGGSGKGGRRRGRAGLSPEEILARQTEIGKELLQQKEREFALTVEQDSLMRRLLRISYEREDAEQRIKDAAAGQREELQKTIQQVEQAKAGFAIGESLAESLIGTSEQLDRVRKGFLEGAKIDEELQKATKEADMLKETMKGVGDIMSGAVKNAISGLIDGTASLNDILSDTLKQLANLFLNYGLRSLTAGLAGNDGIGFFSQLFGGGKASGGTVRGGTSYLVGERGPELFTPGRSGSIAPNNAVGGSNIVVNVDASRSQAQGDNQNAKQLGQAIGAAVQAELIKQKRPGGLLAS